jgi:hypothetical protein
MRIPNISDDQMKKAAMEIYFWQHSNTSSFNNRLFDLFSKADANNFIKLSKGFLPEAKAFMEWQTSAGGGNEFFRKYGVIKDEREKTENVETNRSRVRVEL